MNKYGILVFTIEDDNTYYANSLRRTMISDVPTLAIDTVNIVHNTSNLSDEILAHRLGLVVMSSEIVLKEDLGGDVEFSLDMTCREKEISVTAGMIQTKHPLVKPVNPDTVITKLYWGQQIVLRGRIKQGTGREHAKWMPVSVIGYRIQYLGKNRMKIYLSIEPVGNLSAKTILNKAVKIMKARTEKPAHNRFKAGYLVNECK